MVPRLRVLLDSSSSFRLKRRGHDGDASWSCLKLSIGESSVAESIVKQLEMPVS